MDPSVRNKAVRLSSGATICIEKTIKTHVFQPPPAKRNSSSFRKKRANAQAVRNKPETFDGSVT
jgi:hypothetical protein